MHKNQFSKLANQWWDPHGPMQALHLINPVRTQWISQHINKNPAKVLDIGCGAGILTEGLAKKGHNLTGLDISEKLIRIAKKHATLSDLKINYICKEIDDFAPSMTESFDYITCLEMLEHVDNPEKFIAAAAHCCKKNGRLFFSTINRNLKSWLCAIGAAEHLLQIVPKGTHQYQNFIKPSEINTIAKQYNLELLFTTGIDFNPVTKNIKLIDSLDINYIMCFQKS